MTAENPLDAEMKRMWCEKLPAERRQPGSQRLPSFIRKPTLTNANQR